ncbi:MAG: right-handed parallel beta-helix repeat-containing protein [Gammaproteobacteria bacterium]|nr:right-handed parallel beta-helix repeat-containing protein [Gammaproteobacteria bacterium]
MMPHKLNIIFIVSMLGAIVLHGCGGGGGGGGSSESDTTAPTGTASATIRPFSDSNNIVISFNETMDTAIGSFTLGGSMAAESDGGIWSAESDTLTISPADGAWVSGMDRTLTINARDLAGNPATTISLMLDVYAGTLYFVSSNAADDSGDGLTPATARRNIYGAISAATGPAVVVVNGGSYPTDSSNALTRIEMKDQVSLYGGYSADFKTRNTNTNASSITNASTIESNAFGTVTVGDSIMNPAVIDGFTIYGPSVVGNGSEDASAIVSNGNAVIQNNVLVGGVHSGSGTCAAIVSSAQILIYRNTIRSGGTCSNGFLVSVSGTSTVDIRYNRISLESSRFTAILMTNTNGAMVINNLISTNVTSSNSAGMQLWVSSNSIVRNNTFYSNGSSTYGIYISGGGTGNALIQNNLIYTGAGANSYCIYEHDTAGSPAAVQNNGLFGCSIKYRDNGSGCGGGMDCDLAQLNTLGDMTVDNNVDDDPLLVDLDGADNDINTLSDNNWHYSVLSPTSLTAGGLNGIDESWDFTDDFEGISRPASGSPWAIGAYEP